VLPKNKYEGQVRIASRVQAAPRLMDDFIFSRAQVRSLDEKAIGEFEVPGPVLMENAGRGVAELILSLGRTGKVVICCGKGNNGGDGLVVARHLDIASVPIQVLLFSSADELTSDAALNYRIIKKAQVPVLGLGGNHFNLGVVQQELGAAEWIADALFGTGLSGPVRPPFGDVIEAINASRARVLAVDIPSGLDCDTGQPMGPTVRAEHTATFVGMKKGFLNPQAAPWLGTVHILGIGAPRALVESFARR
jgi:NAD(P)H-hydrate epimerase